MQQQHLSRESTSFPTIMIFHESFQKFVSENINIESGDVEKQRSLTELGSADTDNCRVIITTLMANAHLKQVQQAIWSHSPEQCCLLVFQRRSSTR